MSIWLSPDMSRSGIRPSLPGRGQESRRPQGSCQKLSLSALVCEPRLVDRFAEAGLLDADLDARALFLQAHGDTRVPLAPAPVERLRQVGQGQVRHADRHALLAAELCRQGDVLVG